jgi:hypothetical protein
VAHGVDSHPPGAEGRLSVHRSGRRCRLRLDGRVSPGEIAAHIPERDWERVSWADGTKGQLAARFAALRVRPAKSRGERWLVCERSVADDERKYYLLNLDPTATLHDLVTVVRSR